MEINKKKSLTYLKTDGKKWGDQPTTVSSADCEEIFG